jgi:transcriptional regulator with XRE-family HTH domain
MGKNNMVMQNIERIMREQDLNWPDLARRCGMLRAGIYQVRRINNPRLSTLYRLADALQVHVADFFLPHG